MPVDAGMVLMLMGIGIAVGISAGFIGIGGGVIMVPVLLELFRIQGIAPEAIVHVAMGTSLTVGVLSVGSSAFKHHKLGNVIWRIIPILAVASMAGSWLASQFAVNIPGSWLQKGLAFILLLAAIKFITEKRIDLGPIRTLSWWAWLLMGFGTGIFAGLSGLAGGLVLIPALAYIAHAPTSKLAGTSSGTVLFAAFAGSIGYMMQVPTVDLGGGFVGHVNLLVAGSLAITSVPGAQLGAWLNKKAGAARYKKIFGVFLIIVVIRLFLTA
jgi:uncharacterized protein